MKNIVLLIALLSAGFYYSCENKKAFFASKISADIGMIDSIKVKADSVYSKKYPRTDFVTADYYLNHKDSSITQVMKDDQGTIRQIIIERNKRRIYTASFYSNGQLVAKYNLDNFGQYNDSSKEFFENGFLKSEGVYKNGFHFGKWKNYDSTGKYVNTAEYNQDGQQIKTSE